MLNRFLGDYVVDGKPRALKRARVRQGRFYDPSFHDKASFAREFTCRFGKPAHKGALRIDMIFGMKIPSSLSNKKKVSLEGCPHIKRPDLSNLIKFLEDALQGILYYPDDSYIAEVRATKMYVSEPCTKIRVFG